MNTEATVRINTEARLQAFEAISAGVTEVFAQDIWPEAVRGSRVKTGHNRRSIGVEVNTFGEPTLNTSPNGETTDGAAVPSPNGVSAAIYTQSGYGGWLEIGTRKMKGIPYIYPAVTKFLGRIGEAARRHLER
jgi:hypothetical protein